jgi:cyanophycinase
LTRCDAPRLAALLAPAVALALAAQPASADPLPAVAAARQTRLVLIGGGDRPPEAMARFVEWAGGPTARVLVIPWASGEPKDSCDAILKELEPHHPGAADCGPTAVLDASGKAAPLDAARSKAFLDALAGATGVFFTGGDQARVMDALVDPALLGAIRRRYEAGVVFGGTSAGTAIMSKTMITGDGDFTVIDGAKVGVRPGLGLLEGAIVDQHFVRRQRQNRLFGLVLANPSQRGVGIDEDTALLVRNGRQAEVVGAGVVVLVDAVGADRLALTLRRPDQRFDLLRR